MITNKNRTGSLTEMVTKPLSASVEELQLAAFERGEDSLKTGHYLVTFKENACEEGIQLLKKQGMQIADARDFDNQAVSPEGIGDAEALVFPEIGVALVEGNVAREHKLAESPEMQTESQIESIEPEYFVFPEGNAGLYQPGNFEQGTAASSTSYLTNEKTYSQSSEYLRGFLRATEILAQDLQPGHEQHFSGLSSEVDAQVWGITWGLKACSVKASQRGGARIKVAVLGEGFDITHPDFAGRSITGATFVGAPFHGPYGYGTHITGTACGPKAPVGNIPRYGIGFLTQIFVGKVIHGITTMGRVLAGMNWAIANRCPVILMSIEAPIPAHPAFTAAGQAALNHGCLIIAGAGTSPGSVMAPANSPTIMSVASLDPSLIPSPFSPVGKIEIAAPGKNIFSSWCSPLKYNKISGCVSAAAHVAGCAALWAETSPNLRGIHLWKKLQATTQHLPFPPIRIGAGLVQAP